MYFVYLLMPLFIVELEEDPLESDVTDYEVESEEEEEVVEVLSSGEDSPEERTATKRAFTADTEEESIQVVDVRPAPVQYNASKYFKKKKVDERVDLTGINTH
jgi:hypothetical protein